MIFLHAVFTSAVDHFLQDLQGALLYRYSKEVAQRQGDSLYSPRATRVNARVSRVLGRGKHMFKDSVRLIARLMADLSTISHLNVKLAISTLETEQPAFRDPKFAYISVTFLFTSNTHFQDRHTHFYGTFGFSDVCLTNQARRLSSLTITISKSWLLWLNSAANQRACVTRQPSNSWPLTLSRARCSCKRTFWEFIKFLFLN